ncbi:hypothetical protein M9H77_11280 [Catharanthus roseus]|uniref:Uncharacterized protein n=1 Tax=Catharanthus roseus TaxID=4058 RepID=A0ACC0BE63_CATRO|nr:hypothetical protein M9H77_11280 [Catharanthus roseus]
MMACWVENRNPNSYYFRCQLARIPDYLLVTKDGTKVQNIAAQFWDTALATQVIIASNLDHEFGATLKKANNFLQETQEFMCAPPFNSGITETFSKSPKIVDEKIEADRVFDAVDFVLHLQHSTSKYCLLSFYEAFLICSLVFFFQFLNPTEIFGNALIEHDYVECTSSVIQSLILFHNSYPRYQESEIKSSINRAIKYIEETQNEDGLEIILILKEIDIRFGFWGICYTYASWFGLGALAACGKTYCKSEIVHRACRFLLSKQNENGGWGESYVSCTKMKSSTLINSSNYYYYYYYYFLIMLNGKRKGKRDRDKHFSFDKNSKGNCSL